MLKQVSGLLDHIVAWLPRKPAAYFLLFISWAVTLWFLSERVPPQDNIPKIPHLDKVAHFLYFFGGGALLAAYGRLQWPEVSKRRLFWSVAVICCVIGRLDEYHQGFTPERSGNDTGDWIADSLGGAAGVWAVIVLMLPRISKILETKEEKLP